MPEAAVRELLALLRDAYDSDPEHSLLGALWTVSDTDPLSTLVACYAALVAGRPVLVTDPEQPVPVVTSLPPGAALLLTTSGSTGRPRVIARTWESWRVSFPPFTESE